MNSSIEQILNKPKLLVAVIARLNEEISDKDACLIAGCTFQEFIRANEEAVQAAKQLLEMTRNSAASRTEGE